jgi:hypothetical protein
LQKSKLARTGDVMAHVAMLYLTVVVIVTGLPLNPATWALWFTIDLLVIHAQREAKRDFGLMLAFTVWTGVILSVSLYNLATGRSEFRWGIPEWVASMAVICALGYWRRHRKNETVGVVSTTLALVIAAIPTWVDAAVSPEKVDTLFWCMSASACILGYIGNPKTLIDRFLPGMGTLSNGMIIVLALLGRHM